MHPSMMRGKAPTIVFSSERTSHNSDHGSSHESSHEDPIMDMMDSMRNHDIAGCLGALAKHFAKESTETEG